MVEMINAPSAAPCECCKRMHRCPLGLARVCVCGVCWGADSCEGCLGDTHGGGGVPLPGGGSPLHAPAALISYHDGGSSKECQSMHHVHEPNGWQGACVYVSLSLSLLALGGCGGMCFHGCVCESFDGGGASEAMADRTDGGRGRSGARLLRRLARSVVLCGTLT